MALGWGLLPPQSQPRRGARSPVGVGEVPCGLYPVLGGGPTSFLALGQEPGRALCSLHEVEVWGEQPSGSLTPRTQGWPPAGSTDSLALRKQEPEESRPEGLHLLGAARS